MAAVVCFVVGGVFLYFGLWLVYVMLREGRRARASPGWPTTPGTITAATIEHRRPGRRRSHYLIVPEIAYRYAVGGRNYSGGRVDYGHGGAYAHPTLDLRRAEAYLADFPVGMAVRVYYDPRDPSESVLRPGLMRGDEAASFAAGLALSLAGLALCFIAVQLR